MVKGHMEIWVPLRLDYSRSRSRIREPDGVMGILIALILSSLTGALALFVYRLVPAGQGLWHAAVVLVSGLAFAVTVLVLGKRAERLRSRLFFLCFGFPKQAGFCVRSGSAPLGCGSNAFPT